MDPTDTPLSEISTTFHGGITSDGRIEFYEYSRSMYALSRLLATTEAFRQTGRVPGRISGAANIPIYTYVPEIGSWRQITRVATGAGAKVGASFDALTSWVVGKSLDNIDLFNSNTEAIKDGHDDIDLGLLNNDPSRLSNRRTASQARQESNERPLTAEAIKSERDANRALREARLSIESELAIAKRFIRSEHDSVDVRARILDLEARLKQLGALISGHGVRVYDEERSLISDLGTYISASADLAELDRRGVRADAAVDDIEARINRRILGETLDFSAFDVKAGEEDKLAARARALTRDIVLPLRKSPTSMSLHAGSEGRKIAVIDEVRGRFISDSSLSADAYTFKAFVIEYNRVFQSGRCRIEGLEVSDNGVPFSLRRQLIERLRDKAIDSLKAKSCTMLARAYFDDGGAIRSLLVEDIDFGS